MVTARLCRLGSLVSGLMWRWTLSRCWRENLGHVTRINLPDPHRFRNSAMAFAGNGATTALARGLMETDRSGDQLPLRRRWRVATLVCDIGEPIRPLSVLVYFHCDIRNVQATNRSLDSTAKGRPPMARNIGH